MTNKSISELPDALADERVLTANEVCTLAHIHRKTLSRYLKRGIGPRTIRLSTQKLGVRVKDMRAWLESRAITAGDAA
jgi:predicted DNA-binding transcriptional regulator AlpA